MHRHDWMTLISLTLMATGTFACGKIDSEDQDRENAENTVPGMVQVAGNAQFGSQCPYGTINTPREVPLTLWECPIGMKAVQLSNPLPPIVLQADCKKKVMDVRGMSRNQASNAWEIMPDGSFYFAIDGGYARLKTDSTGKKDCNIPLTAELWGKLECEDRDRVKIKLETVWRAVKYNPSPNANPTSSPTPSGTDPNSPQPVGAPNLGPRPNLRDLPPPPTGEFSPIPGLSPSPSLSPTLIPGPAVTISPTPSLGLAPTPRPTGIVNTGGNETDHQCNIPPSCYFHALTQIDQCY